MRTTAEIHERLAELENERAAEHRELIREAEEDPGRVRLPDMAAARARADERRALYRELGAARDAAGAWTGDR